MTDLQNLVPPHEPAEDALAFAARAGANLIPVIGQLTADTISHVLEARQAERRHEFDVAIAEALTDVMARVDDSVSVEAVLTSDEFIAVTRTQRAAAETASRQRRRRLAAAVANGGEWAPFSASEREQFTRLIDDFDDLHVWMLHYFWDPAGWLKKRGLFEQHSSLMMGGIAHPMESALGAPQKSWNGPVAQAAADLDRAGLAFIPLTTTMSAQGIFERRTSAKGRRFLEFILETDSVGAEPPEAL